MSEFYDIGMWLPWSATKGQYITSGSRFNRLPEDNLQNCMTRCLRDPTGSKECRAITISTSSDKTCELRADKVGDEAFVSSSTAKFQSFSRPAWYLGRLLYIILVQYNSAFNSLT